MSFSEIPPLYNVCTSTGMASSSFLALLFAVLATAKGQLSDYPDRYPDGYPDGYPGEVGQYQGDGLIPGDGPYLGDGPVVGGAGLYPGDGPYPDPYPGDGPYPDGEGVYPGPDIYPTDGYPTDYEGGYNIRYGNPYKDPHVRDPRKYRHGYQYGLSPEDIAFIIREKAFPANMHIVPRTLY